MESGDWGHQFLLVLSALQPVSLRFHVGFYGSLRNANTSLQEFTRAEGVVQVLAPGVWVEPPIALKAAFYQHSRYTLWFGVLPSPMLSEVTPLFCGRSLPGLGTISPLVTVSPLTQVALLLPGHGGRTCGLRAGLSQVSPSRAPELSSSNL